MGRIVHTPNAPERHPGPKPRDPEMLRDGYERLDTADPRARRRDEDSGPFPMGGGMRERPGLAERTYDYPYPNNYED